MSKQREHIAALYIRWNGISTDDSIKVLEKYLSKRLKESFDVDVLGIEIIKIDDGDPLPMRMLSGPKDIYKKEKE